MPGRGGNQVPSRVYLEAPSARRQDEFLSLVKLSKKLHTPWTAPPATGAAYASYLHKCQDDSFRGFFVCVKETDELAGVFNLSQIVRGPLNSAYLGYYAFQPSSRRGYMTEGLRLVLSKAFTEVRLHRVEANIQPTNLASIQLVRKLGFSQEGYSPRYLKIRGRWRDHERWALLAEDWRRN